MKQPFYERFLFFICKHFGHRKNKNDMHWQFNGHIRTTCKRCGVVYKVGKIL